VNTDTTSAMQEALQAAVKRMNNAPPPPEIPSPTDPFGMLMSIIPKLINGNGDRDDVLDAQDAIKKEDVAEIQAGMEAFRKMLYRVSKMQEQTIAELRELQKHQVALSQAVLDLAGHLERIQIVPGGDDDSVDESRDDRDDRAGRDGADVPNSTRLGNRDNNELKHRKMRRMR